MKMECRCGRDAGNLDQGVALVEVLLASALMLIVGGVVLMYVAAQSASARAQPEAADVQQRARAVADVLTRELSTAGGWSQHGGADGALACCVPGIQPRRIGLRSADPPGVARENVVTVTRLAGGAIPGRIRDPLIGPDLVVAGGKGCPVSDGACGLRDGDTVLIFEPDGRHDFFLIGPPSPMSAPVVPRQVGVPLAYASGAIVAAAETRTLYFDAGARQLRQYDGHLSDTPVVDHVAAVRFEYWGEEGAPARTRLDADAGTDGCWFDAAGIPRFGASVAASAAPLVRLSIDDFRDGPWCGAGENRFDADLLRIRRVRAVVRVSPALEAVRAGRVRDARQLVPDFDVVVDVVPRGLNADR